MFSSPSLLHTFYLVNRDTQMHSHPVSILEKLICTCLLFVVACTDHHVESTEAAMKHLPSNAPKHFGFGRPASAAKISAWDIDVRPDGKGLPAGEGRSLEGR